MSDTVVVGLDIGGTSTRATVLTLTGQRVGTGRAGGGNPTSHGAERAAAELLTALREALADLDPTRVAAGTIGLAGAGRLLADPAGRAAFDQAWHDAGLRCPYAVHGDALVAYASGTAAPDGTILIAGTGAITAQVHELRLDRIADGHGWLLGDAGSGFWLGREAVRRLLADLDAGRTPGALATAVLTELLGSAEIAARPRATVDATIQAVTRRPPVELARLAPLVVDAATHGDPVATALITEAAAPPGRERGPHPPRRGGDTDRARRRPAHRATPRSPPPSGPRSPDTGRTRRCAPPETAPPPQPGSPPVTYPRSTDPAALHARLFPAP